MNNRLVVQEWRRQKNTHSVKIETEKQTVENAKHCRRKRKHWPTCMRVKLHASEKHIKLHHYCTTLFLLCSFTAGICAIFQHHIIRAHIFKRNSHIFTCFVTAVAVLLLLIFEEKIFIFVASYSFLFIYTYFFASFF